MDDTQIPYGSTSHCYKGLEDFECKSQSASQLNGKQDGFLRRQTARVQSRGTMCKDEFCAGQNA